MFPKQDADPSHNIHAVVRVLEEITTQTAQTRTGRTGVVSTEQAITKVETLPGTGIHLEKSQQMQTHPMVCIPEARSQLNTQIVAVRTENQDPVHTGRSCAANLPANRFMLLLYFRFQKR